MLINDALEFSAFIFDRLDIELLKYVVTYAYAIF